MAKQKHADGFEVFEGMSKEGARRPGNYWRLWRKGRIVADGAEGYSRRGDCLRAVRRLRSWAGKAPIRTA